MVLCWWYSRTDLEGQPDKITFNKLMLVLAFMIWFSLGPGLVMHYAEGAKNNSSANIPKARQVLRKLLRDSNGVFSPIMISSIKSESSKTFEFKREIMAGSLLYMTLVPRTHLTRYITTL